MRPPDFKQIDFPSDKLTIKQLRKMFSDRFDSPIEIGRPKPPIFFLDPNGYGNAGDLLGQVLYAEREMVFMGWAEACGLGSASHSDPIGSDLKQQLIKNYITLELAHGEHEASELARSLISVGRTLAVKSTPSI